jgi:CubicO group peptidase (beta-lactamase class C family)
MADVKARLAGLDAWIDAQMAAWKIPGFAIAVVHKGEVVHCKGYGLRDAAQNLPVTPETVFAIGSCSKAFTATTAGLLVDDGKLDWDAPIRRYIPEFRMHDPAATEGMTALDLLSHRSGLPRHDLMWYGSALSRQELLTRLEHLKPNKPFRYRWEYQNLMFMTAGILVERISGLSWEEFVRQRIFAPLGMNASNLSVTESEKLENAALPYADQKGHINRIPYRNIDAIGPAGSINSNLIDMTAWLMMNVRGGQHNGSPFIKDTTLAQIHAPVATIPLTSDRPMAQYNEVSMLSYGLGWGLETYRGHKMIWHTGGIDGFIAFVSFMPDDDMGVIAFVNLDGNLLPLFAAHYVYDLLLGLDEVPWGDRMKEMVDKMKAAGDEGKAKFAAARKPDTQPSHALDDYAGSYQHPGYGALTITKNGDGLTAAYNNLTLTVTHYHYDVFEFASTYPEATLPGTFATDVSGAVAQVTLPLEPAGEPIVFKRVGEPV